MASKAMGLAWVLFTAALGTCATSKANPIILIPPAVNEVAYIASEKLNVRISPSEALVEGRFTFQYRRVPKRPSEDDFLLKLPLWFPVISSDPSVGAFWESFGPPYGVKAIKAENREIFNNAVRLTMSAGEDPMPIKIFSIDPEEQRGALRKGRGLDRVREPGFRCIIVHGWCTDGVLRSATPLKVSYRQPLRTSDGVGHFVYVPIFDHLPKKISTSDTNRYSVTITAAPGCTLTVRSGKECSTIEGGKSAVFSPRHLEAIRVVTHASAIRSTGL